MLRAIYRALWWLIAPLAVLRLLIRSRKERGYREHIGERFGYSRGRLPEDSAPLIWVHAVSVGETRAAQPLIDALIKARPDARILLTHMTPVARPLGVMCVRRMRASGRALISASTSGCAARVSPTDTACTQISGVSSSGTRPRTKPKRSPICSR